MLQYHLVICIVISSKDENSEIIFNDNRNRT